MSIDISQFLQTFYEESFEGLDIMEKELLNLDVGAADIETVNTIFRAAHSIKGGSGTFGLNAVASYTHVMETLLDEMRSGKRSVTQDAVNVLLRSVDVLREMLLALRENRDLDTDGIADSHRQLTDLLNASGKATEVKKVAAVATAAAGWSIKFRPHLGMLTTGNDPVRMLREVASLGEAKVQLDYSTLPSISELDPENSYLSWNIELLGNIEKQAITEIFDWVEGDCDLQVDAIAGVAGNGHPLGLNVAALEKSFNLIAPKAEALVARFYEELFKRYPQVIPMFAKTEPKKQQKMLLGSLQLVMANLNNVEALAKSLTALGERHEKYGAVEAHYEAVATTLMDVMKEFAGAAWTREVQDAWAHALGTIAQVMLKAYGKDERRSTPDRRSSDERRKPASTESASIRVSIEKVDELINTVGELVITQSMLGQFANIEELTKAHLLKLSDGLAQLERNTRELQESVMRIRMMPISNTFQRFPRLVHDMSGKLGKKIELKMSGEQTELDKTVMEKIGDPLVHLVRNSMDHGIEMPDVRKAAGKAETGVVALNAYHQGGNIVIEISDDGAGLNKEKILKKARERGMVREDENPSDEQVFDLIFAPGLSTAEVVSDISGRGVGMDVVRKNIRALGGAVDVKSTPGKGTTFLIRLPLTLAILDGQLIRVSKDTYIIPLVSIVESLQVKRDKVNVITGRGEVYKLRDEYIPIIRMYQLFNTVPDNTDLENGLLVVVEADGKKVALFIDDLQSQQQVVIKSLESNYKKVDGLSGATILGDGTVALILDVTELVSLFNSQSITPNLRVVGKDGLAA